MDDKELLELAANAAGLKVLRSRLDDPMNRDFLVEGGVRNPHHNFGPWNPLNDDGDAFRLAVKLRIKFLYNETLGQSLAWTGAVDSFETQANIEDCARDERCASRRAVVLAAAEIGRQAQADRSNHGNMER